MALASGAHVEIGGVGFLLDEAYEQITGRRCYVHGGRSIFAGRTDITGKPGSQNLKEDLLVWSLTRYDGEGQVVLDPADPASAFRFYRSEGLNFRTPGQAKLNKSTISTQMLADNAGTTQQGSDFVSISGTAPEDVNTDDTKLTVVGDVVGSAASVAYAANPHAVQLDFYLYREAFADQDTPVQASAMVTDFGSTETSGTDVIMLPNSRIRTVSKATGTDFTATDIQRVEFYLDMIETNPSLQAIATVECTVVDVTSDRTIAGKTVSVPSASSAGTSPKVTLNFDPRAGHSYRFSVMYSWGKGVTGADLTVDKITFGPELTENTAKIELYDQDTGSTVQTKTVAVTAETKGSIAGSLSFTSTAGKNYRARVTRVAGKQDVILDKVVWNDNDTSTVSWVIDCLDLGRGTQSSGNFTPRIYASAKASGADNQLFAWNTSTNVWDSIITLDSAAGTNNTTRAMAHSDSREYVLLSSGEVIEVYDFDTTVADLLKANTINGPVGLAVAQERLWVLSEGTNIIVYSLPLEGALTPGLDITDTANGARQVTVSTSTKTPDTTLRQRMCGTPTGVRFFVNYGDVSAKIFEVDGSGTTLAPRQLADLGTGIKATCIAYESGITFVGAQYYGETGTSDTDKKPRSVLFAIDQNGVVQRIGFFRKDDPDVRPPQFLVPYQTDLYILQGKYVWRYSLVTGGLFLEYELDPTTANEQRALAVLFGRTFAAFEDEVFVTGSVGTYRQASVADGNSYTSSVYDFGLPAVKKALARIDVITDELDSGTSVRVEYQTDQDGTWTLAGVHTTGSSTSFYATETTFTSLQVRATLVSANGTATPVLRGLTVWASAAEDEEYFDLVLLTEDQDSNFRIANEQAEGSEKAAHIVNLWRRKAVTTLKDGYANKATGTEDYLVTIEDLRVEQTALGEGRTVVTLRVVR